MTSCCVNFYQNDLARFLLGDSWHPGGIELTRVLGDLSRIGKESKVLDVACGIGTSVRFLQETYHCTCLGMDAGKPQLQHALKLSGTYFQGDAEWIPVKMGSVDVVMIECALSTFHNQTASLDAIRMILRPGGILAISDMVVEGKLPPSFDESISSIACLAKAHSVRGYESLLSSLGFNVVHRENRSRDLKELVLKIRSNIFASELFSKLKNCGVDSKIDFGKARTLIDLATELIDSNVVGYWAVIASRK